MNRKTSINILDGLDLAKHLSVANALSDSPVFRHSLTKAELIASQIDAQYQLTKESCHQAVKTGSEFASSLAHLTYCLDVSRLPRQICSLGGLSDQSSCEMEKSLSRLNHLLLQFANGVQEFTSRISEPVKMLSDAQAQLVRLAELRQNFFRATTILQSLQDRLAGGGNSRTQQNDVDARPIKLEEARATCQTAASAYMKALCAAIGHIPLVTYLRTNSAIFSAHRRFLQNVSDSFDKPIASGNPADVAALANWVETTRLFDLPPDGDQQQQQRNSDPSSSQPKLSATQIEGYLFKRNGKMTWRHWARRWFRLRNNKLMYCKQSVPVTAADLQASTEECLEDMRKCMSAIGFYSTSNCNQIANGSSSNLPVEDEGVTETVNSRRTRLLHQTTPSWKVMESDLRLCTARHTYVPTGRRFTFELIAPASRVYHLQALTSADQSQWIEALSSGLLHYQRLASSPLSVGNEDCSSYSSYNASHLQKNNSRRPIDYGTCKLTSPPPSMTSPTGASPERQPRLSLTSLPSTVTEYDRLRNQGGIALTLADNRQCADCSVSETSWASINLGVTLCTPCAAAHRSLGVHISKIRSLTLDNWDPEPLHVIMSLGNRLVNRVYEMLPVGGSTQPQAPVSRPTAASSSDERRLWARAKWAHCNFVRLPLVLGGGGGGGGGPSNSTDPTAIDDSTWFLDLYRRWQEMRHQVRLARKASFASSSVSLGSFTGDKNPAPTASPQSDVKSRQKTYRMSLLLAFCLSVGQPSQSSTQLQSGRPASGAEHASLVSHLLAVGARIGCPPLMLAALAGGAHPDTATALGDLKGTPIRGRYCGKRPQRYSTLDEASVCPPLVWAVHSGSLAACEFLLLNGADINQKDNQDRTALFHACQLELVHIVCLLLRRCANQMIPNRDNRLPLDVALELGNADIVTLLRVQRLRDNTEMQDEFLVDETATEVLQDFTSRAYFIESDVHSSNSSIDSSLEPGCTGYRHSQVANISVSKLVTYLSDGNQQKSDRVIIVRPSNDCGSPTASQGCHTTDSRVRLYRNLPSTNRRSRNPPARFSRPSSSGQPSVSNDS